LQIEQIQLATLIPYINNSRTHSDEQVAQIAASIKEFGFNNPILVDKDSGIIAGHGRLQAARKLGLTEVPCVRLEHLTETQRKAYIIADNRLALNAGWDNELLRFELNELDGNIDLSLLGFTVPELTIAMGFGADFEPGTEDDQGKLDQKDPIICPACSHEFHK
jgi:ParB family transcriptional regulator, chromosome partitioning protein